MAKTTVDGGTFFVIVFVLGLALAAAYSGWLYQTGQQWFENCWQAQHSPEGPKTPRQAVSWGTCEQTTKRALFNAGFVFAGNPQFAVTPELKALVQACPSNYSDVPIGGPHLIAVDLVVQRGGPDLLDRFM